MRSPRRAAVAAALAPLAVGAVLLSGLTPATAKSNAMPVGAIDSVSRNGYSYGVIVRGYAADPGTSAPAAINVSIDGVRKVSAAPANRPHGSTSTGFAVAVPNVAAGTHKVCASVNDYPTNRPVLLGCRSITLNYDPIGRLDPPVITPGHLSLAGFAIDRDFPRQITSIAIWVDGKSAARAVANQPYPNLAHWYPGAGDYHGFTLSIPVTEGTHRVCMRVHNLGQGSDAFVTCYAQVTANFSPHGQIINVRQIPGGVHVDGWAVDPDTKATTSVTVSADGRTLGTAVANQPGTGYSFHADFSLGSGPLAPGPRTICVTAMNLGPYGKNTQIGCTTQTFNWNPSGGLDKLTQNSPGGGAVVTGWATDPDTNGPISVRVSEGTRTLATTVANSPTGTHPGHSFSVTVPETTNGSHTLCVTALNVQYGNGNSTPACASATFNFQPYGTFETATRDTASTNVIATGWAIDPDTTAPVQVQVSIDGKLAATVSANGSRPDIGAQHPGMGNNHGFSVSMPATDGEHRVCTSALNIGGGSGSTNLGCKIVNAVHPTAPSAPSGVSAQAGYGGARILWTAPTSDGGAPWTGYTVKALPNGPSVTVGPTTLAATLLGLAPSTNYSFSVVANNVAGSSAPGTSSVVTTQKEPPAQTTPAPVSTSRYIRNVHGASSSDLAMMRNEGAADAKANPSGHGYLSVLAVGGQDESRKGVILTAGIRYVSYADMVKDVEAYIDGYASQQKPSAPVTIALATNNDIDVYRGSGASFANNIVNPVAAYAARYPGITIAGSDDMEPGFSAGYATTKAWLQGYMAATSAPFVFTGSADGCAWSYANGSCNNGWSASGLYYLSGGVDPIKTLGLPQIYNSTMAAQWRYISLTGVLAGRPKINFGGALTEYTACAQAGSCGSLTGHTAWTYLWNQLRADSRLKPSTLPYSTDLRIDS